MRPVLRRLLDQAGFSPRQLFAALQGAWLEPKQGLIWQENTGVTPTTTGGQTIGLMLDQSQGAVLGPELVTNGSFDSDTAWTKGSDWSITGGAAVCTGATAGSTTVLTQAITWATSKRYQLTLSVTRTSGTLRIYIPFGQPGIVDITASGTYTYPVSPVSTNATVDFGSFSSAKFVGSIDNVSIKEILGNHAYQATAANRPTLQFNGALPLARHDATDSLVVSLPSINVRRNLLTYSEQFDNAVWQGGGGPQNLIIVPNATLGPFGRPAFFWRTTTTPNAEHFLYGPFIGTMTSGNAYTISAIVKAAGYNWFRLAFPADKVPANERAAWFNLTAGEKGTVQPNVTATISGLRDGWYLCTISRAITNTTAGASFFPLVTNADNSIQFTADGVSGIYVAGFQIELGSVATDYQKITDWTSEAFASSGSVYFSTPVGMSQLNNQSMGTTYQLPALSSDIYSWIVVPQRLNAAQESKLAVYMQQKAGIAGPDILWESVRRNLLKYSQNLTLSPWNLTTQGAGSAVVRTANYAAAPDGSMTATRLQCNLNGGTTTGDRSYIGQAGVSYSLSYITYSLWLKLNSGTNATVYITCFDNSFSVNITDSWVRYTFTSGGAMTMLATIEQRIGLIGGRTPAASDSVDLLVWGVQLEPGTSATAYQRIDAGPDPYTIVQEQLSDDAGDLIFTAQ